MKFYPNPESEDQWSCSRPMSQAQWETLKKAGWRYCWDEMKEQETGYNMGNPYYWFSTSSKHFITSPMAQQGEPHDIIDMIARATPEGSVVPEGFVLVPKCDTPEMMDAGRATLARWQNSSYGVQASYCYQAMLKAAADKERKE